MSYLLDTATFLWMALQPEKLSKKASQILGKGENKAYLSAVSTWEIVIKSSLGKLELSKDPADFIENAILKMDLALLPITHQHALAVTHLPFHHKDPFDRLLIAQAKIENLPVITPDRHFKSYGIDIIW